MIKELSSRENEVVEHIARGFTVKEIASKLFISPYTVDTHIKKSKIKTGCKNFADITREFILSLEDPKQYFRTKTAMVFVALQMCMSLFSFDGDLRKPNRTRTRTYKTAIRIQS